MTVTSKCVIYKTVKIDGVVSSDVCNMPLLLKMPAFSQCSTYSTTSGGNRFRVTTKTKPAPN
jgi:hypothetical protein